MSNKKLRKQIIKMQNQAARRGGHIPSVAQCRLAIQRKEEADGVSVSH